jgi:type III secretion system FlhB-like substrate exporter
MMNTATMTEAQIKTAARKIARKANRLRAKGDHAAADKLVNEARDNVEAMRRAGLVTR